MSDTADQVEWPDPSASSSPGVPRPPYTPSGFIGASRRFAHAAASEYSAEDASFFFLHAGAAVELLLKAALCAASPALLIEGRQVHDDSLIRLLGYEPVRRQAGIGGSPRRTHGPPHTIGLANAMDRFELLYGPDTLGAPRDDLDLLKAARDLAAHGEGSQEVTQDMHRVLVTLATVVEVVLPRLDVSPVEFWGSYSSLIARAMEKQRDRIVDRVRTLISAARQRFDAKYDGIPPEGLEALMTESWWDQPFQNDEWARVCPACEAQGISRLRAEVRRRAVHPDLQKRTVPGYKAINFRCHVCKLALESEELVDAAEDFEAWEEVGDLEFWAEDIDSETLTPEDRRDLGFEHR